MSDAPTVPMKDDGSSLHDTQPGASLTVLADGRDMSGETVMGMRVAAYRHPVDCPPDCDPDEWLRFFRGSPPNTYAEHWSTPGAHRTDVERLFAESDVRAMIAATQQATGEGVALADKLEAIVNLGWAKGDDAIIREAARTLRALSTQQAVSPPEGAPVLPAEVREKIARAASDIIFLRKDHPGKTERFYAEEAVARAREVLSTITGDA